MIWGIDISRYQGAFDLHRARREGFDFVVIKATEGTGWVDPQFARNLRLARETGLIHAAYHYQRSNVSAAAQAAHITRVVPKDCPVILDVEEGGGGIALTRDLNARLNAAGYRTPLLYLPRWYWERIGSPSLAGLPPLWYSRYANNQGGTAADIYNRNATWFAKHWGGYGGLRVEVLQFTSSATVAGHAPVDANAYRGTRQQLAALFGGATTAPPQEDDLTPDQARKLDEIHHELFGPRGPQGQIVGWGTEAGNHTVVGLLVQMFNALMGPRPSRYPGSTVKVPAVDAIRDTNGLVFQLPSMIAAAGKTDPKAVAEALRPVIAEAAGPVIREAVADALGADNTEQADAIVTALAARLAGQEAPRV